MHDHQKNLNGVLGSLHADTLNLVHYNYAIRGPAAPQAKSLVLLDFLVHLEKYLKFYDRPLSV